MTVGQVTDVICAKLRALGHLDVASWTLGTCLPLYRLCWGMCEALLARNAWDMFGTCFGHVRDMFGICLGYVRDMFGACLGRVGACLEHVWYMFGSCLAHDWGMCEASSTHVVLFLECWDLQATQREVQGPALPEQIRGLRGSDASRPYHLGENPVRLGAG